MEPADLQSRALFPALLGAAFHRLAPPVQELHRGSAGTWYGTATVTRGTGWRAALACAVARLPPSMRDAPLRFELRIARDREIWTRWFGDSPPMRSSLRVDQVHLAEHLGPAHIRFALREVQGAMNWEATGLRLLGIALPRGAFDLRARISTLAGQYHFAIDASITGIGSLIRYEGTLRPGA